MKKQEAEKRHTKRKRVLIVNSKEGINSLIKKQFEETPYIEVLFEKGPEEAKYFVKNKGDKINLFIIGTCLENQRFGTAKEPATLSLVKKISEAFPDKIIIGVSSVQRYREDFIRAGCHMCLVEKTKIAQIILSYL